MTLLIPIALLLPLKKRVTNYFNSSEGRSLHYKSNANRIKNQKDYVQEASTGYDDFSHSLDIVGEAMVSFQAEYMAIKAKYNKLRAQNDYEVEQGRDTSLEVDANVASTKAERAQSSYESDYYSNANGVIAGQTARVESFAIREQAEIARLEARFTRDLLERLKKVDGPFAKFLLAALLTQAPQMLGNAVDFGAKALLK